MWSTIASSGAVVAMAIASCMLRPVYRKSLLTFGVISLLLTAIMDITERFAPQNKPFW